METYNRYDIFKQNGTFLKVPFVKLKEKSSDYYETYNKGFTRLDRVSYDYYGDPNYDWLIMLANPEYGSMEFEIEDNAELRIPYPLKETLEDYIYQVQVYNKLYGLD